MRIRVNVMQAYPCAMRPAECVELAREFDEARLHRSAAEESRPISHVNTVSARVLRYDEQLLYTGAQQPFRFSKNVADRTRHEIAAHRRNDAERAAVIASFADLQIRIVTRRELDALWRNEIDDSTMAAFVGEMRGKIAKLAAALNERRFEIVEQVPADADIVGPLGDEVLKHATRDARIALTPRVG